MEHGRARRIPVSGRRTAVRLSYAGGALLACAASAFGRPGGKVSARIEIHFRPLECRETAVREIDAAGRFVRLALPRQCSEEIASALIRAHERGCKVTVLLPAAAARSTRGPVQTLKSKDVEVKYASADTAAWSVPFAVIDDQTVLAGSAAWVAYAGGAHESLLVIEGEPVVRKYLEEWKRLAELKVAPADESAPFLASRRSGKFHRSTCRWAKRIAGRNRLFLGATDEARRAGYQPCSICRPDQPASEKAPGVEAGKPKLPKPDDASKKTAP